MNSSTGDTFDPYHKWLGISPQDQPPNHYRLLGIELFEADPDVISNAADGRMAQLKNFQTGKRSALSQRLLNEIAAAKICLLNAGKKAEYDRQLRARMEAPPATGSGAVVSAVAAGADAASPSPLDLADFSYPSAAGSVSPSSGRSKRKPKPFPWPILAISGGALLVLAGVVIYLVSSGGDHPVADRKKTAEGEQAAAAGLTKTPKTQIAKTAPTKPSAEEPKEKTGAGEVAKFLPKEKETPDPREKLPQDVNPNDDPAKTTGGDELKPPPDRAEKTEGAEKPENKPVGKPPQEPSGPKKPPVPGDAEQAAAKQKVRELFQKEIAAAHAEARKALAETLLQRGSEMTDDPAARYALWHMAAEASLSGGDPDRAFECLDRIAAQYDADGPGMKTDLLSSALGSLRPGPASAEYARLAGNAALGQGEVSVRGDKFDEAARWLALARIACQKCKDPDLNQEVRTFSDKLNQAKRKHTALQAALETLAQDAADPKANLEAGRWYCFDKGNWDKGLPLLAKCSQSQLQALAEQDLKRPSEAAEQKVLADAWWALAEKAPAASKSAIQLRAVYWYEQALPKLSSLDKSLVQKRIEPLKAAAQELGKRELPGLKGGTVAPGNVALAKNGAVVQGVEQLGELLIDGDPSFGRSAGYAYSVKLPCEWVFTFDRTYRLRQLRLLLLDLDNRTFNYSLLVSEDGSRFTLLADRSKGQWRGWQVLDFPPRPVKAVKVIGFGCSLSKIFQACEFEAYCIPPDRPAK